MRQVIEALNIARSAYLETNDKRYWWQMIQLLPSSYNQKRTIMLNYEVLANIYKSRKNHKLDEWVDCCKWIETLPYSGLITGCSKPYRKLDSEHIKVDTVELVAKYEADVRDQFRRDMEEAIADSIKRGLPTGEEKEELLDETD